MLTAEIIAVGSELLTPFRTDTNSLWLTDRLNAAGVEVRLKTIVGDDDARLEETIRDALKRSGIVVLTGGLGPTEDDITRKIAARALGRRLLLDEKVLDDIKAKFLRWGRKMPDINARQAMVVEGAEVLPNPNGTAPGMYVEHEVRVAGMGESAVDERIAPVYTQYKNPQTTILFNNTEIEIHLTAQGKTEQEAELLLDGLAGQIEERLGHAIFAFRGETMEEVVGLRLAVSGFTVATAESCTGGLISQRLTSVSGSSNYFMEGVVTYSNEAKTRLLGVPAELIAARGAVSAEVAEAMAEGVKRRAATDFGLAVTGVAGPGGGTPEKPVGLVYISLSDDAHTEHRRVMLPGDRHLIRWRASQAALDLLRRRLI